MTSVTQTISVPRQRGLSAGETRIDLLPLQASLLRMTLIRSREQIDLFDDRFGILGWSNMQLGINRSAVRLLNKLHDSDDGAVLTMTKEEREHLHTILAIALEQPAAFGATDRVKTGVVKTFLHQMEMIRRKLPPRGAGCY